MADRVANAADPLVPPRGQVSGGMLGVRAGDRGGLTDRIRSFQTRGAEGSGVQTGRERSLATEIRRATIAVDRAGGNGVYASRDGRDPAAPAGAGRIRLRRDSG